MSSIKPDPNLLKKYPNAITLQQLEEKARFLGTLAGLAVGESLGAPYENKKAGTFQPVKEIIGGGLWEAGEPTDDVELTLALLRVVARGKLDLDGVAQNYLRWFNNKPKDVGNLTRSALLNLRAGDPPSQSGALAWEDSGRKAAGNGSVMCCAPIGLLHFKHLDNLAEDAAAVSKITHYDPRCVGGCVAVATAIALLVRGEHDEAIARAAAAGGAISDEVLAVIERAVNKKPSSSPSTARTWIRADRARDRLLGARLGELVRRGDPGGDRARRGHRHQRLHRRGAPGREVRQGPDPRSLAGQVPRAPRAALAGREPLQSGLVLEARTSRARRLRARFRPRRSGSRAARSR